MPFRKSCRATRIARQQIKKIPKLFFVSTKHRRELPQDRAKFFAQAKNSGGEKVCERDFDIAQPFRVRDESATFYAKNKTGGRLAVPTLIARWPLQGIKRAVDFDRIKLAAGKFQFTTMREIGRIKNTA